MASKVGLLRYLGDLVPIPESRNRWLLCKILDDKFYNRDPFIATSPFKCVEGGNQ